MWSCVVPVLEPVLVDPERRRLQLRVTAWIVVPVAATPAMVSNATVAVSVMSCRAAAVPRSIGPAAPNMAGRREMGRAVLCTAAKLRTQTVTELRYHARLL